MTVFSDVALLNHGSDIVTPFNPEAVGPCSIDLSLGNTLLRMPYGVMIDPEQDQSDLWQEAPLASDGRWVLGQGSLYLGVTVETVTVPADAVAFLHGVSSLGRLGLVIHVTAGLVDSGWSGPLTLEIVSLGGNIRLRPGMRIGQLTFFRMDGEALRLYGGRYVNSSTEPTPSRAHLDGRPS